MGFGHKLTAFLERATVVLRPARAPLRSWFTRLGAAWSACAHVDAAAGARSAVGRSGLARSFTARSGTTCCAAVEAARVAGCVGPV